jgi:hypothetical protein
MPSATARSHISPILSIPVPYIISNSAVLNGGATLFLTIFALVLEPTNSLPGALIC